jgi:hypothetical protein
MIDIEKYRAEADMEDFIASYVRPEEFIRQCEACPNFGRLWSCPPYAFDVLEFWKGFGRIKIAAYKIKSDGDPERLRRDLAETKKAWGKSWRRRRPSVREARASRPAAASFARPARGRRAGPAAIPKKEVFARILGSGRCVKALRDLFGIELQWMKDGKPPEYLVLAGGLLTKAGAEPAQSSSS